MNLPELVATVGENKPIWQDQQPLNESAATPLLWGIELAYEQVGIDSNSFNNQAIGFEQDHYEFQASAMTVDGQIMNVHTLAKSKDGAFVDEIDLFWIEGTPLTATARARRCGQKAEDYQLTNERVYAIAKFVIAAAYAKLFTPVEEKSPIGIYRSFQVIPPIA